MKARNEKILPILIGFYRKHISPNTPPSCRFIPTCWEYANWAVERFGPAKDSLLVAKRIAKLECGLFFEFYRSLGYGMLLSHGRAHGHVSPAL